MTPTDDGWAVPSLLGEAEARSGLADWGDQAFAANLGRLVASCRETAGLTAAGWEVLHKVVLRHLRNRLYVQAHVRSHPESARAELGAPAFVTGLPRTGTTLLHNLLAVDPANRVLRFWEALHPVPPDGRPGRPGAAEADLVARAEAWLERSYALTPELRTIHGATARGPEECDALLQNSFASQHFDDMFRADTYSAWLNHAELAAEYAYYALQLRVLTRPGDAPRRWVLKSPAHLGYLATLLRMFPEATIVFCHRDPTEAVASYASLVLAVRRPYTDQLSLAEVGAHALRRSSAAMARALEARETAPAGRFVDVAYRDLVVDPAGTVKALYERLGRPLGDDATAAMGRWLADNPQHKHGRHEYDLGRFGLTPGAVTEALARYRDRFGRFL